MTEEDVPGIQERCGVRILHLDDDPVWQERVARALAGGGMQVDAHVALPDVWSRLGRGEYDFVIAEYMTGSLGVQELLEGLLRGGILVPVGVLTTQADPLLHLTMMEWGAEFCLRKDEITGATEAAFAAAVHSAAERHRAAVSCRQMSRVMEAILHAVPMGMCVVRDHRILWCNTRMNQVLGFTKGELIGMDTTHLMGSEAEHLHIDSQIFATGPGGWGAVEGELRRKDGSTITCQIFARPLDPRDLSQGQIIIGRDTGEFEQMKRLLRMSESRVNDLIENANSIILRMDRQGRIRFINRYGESFFGYSSGELEGKHLLDTIVPRRSRSGRDLAGMIQAMLENPDEYEVNVNENIKKNGDRAWIAWTNKPIRDEKGAIVEILSIGNDISDRKLDVGDARLAIAPWKTLILRDTDIEGEVFQAVFDIALEISREGREGKAVGTTFLIGDAKEVLAHSRQLILNPFEGHRPETRMITSPELRETIKELAQLDGAFVVGDHGVVEAAGRYITTDTSTVPILKGLGTRHASVAGITQVTRAVGIVVSQSGGRISIFKDGRLLRVVTPGE